MNQISLHLKWIDSQKRAMFNLLKEWCEINSGSSNLEGLSQMIDLLAARFSSLGGTVHQVQLPPKTQIDDKGNPVSFPSAKALHIAKRPEAPIQVFLGGHMDTVYGKEHPFQKTSLLKENVLRGPGAADMKGGLVILLTALEAFERHPEANKIGWQILINPDEETGSVSSEELLLSCAKRSLVGLIFEPSFQDGALVSSRKGSVTWTMVARGKAAHAGRNFQQGCNAIHGIAQFIVDTNQISKKHSRATINFGQILGGGPPNVVPDFALCRFNVRYADQTEIEQLSAEFYKSMARITLQDPRLTLSLHLMSRRPPKKFAHEEKELFDQFNEAAHEEGYALSYRPSGGVSDGNLIAQTGIPVLDTLGAIGGEIHTENEYVLLDSLTARARLTARYLIALALKGAPYAN